MLAVVGISNLVILALVTAAIGAVTWSRLWGRNQMGHIAWSDAWLKAAAIVVTAIMLIAYLPSRVLQTGTVAGYSRPVQDVIGSGVWAIGLAVVVIGLRVLHRDKRV